MPSWLAFPAPQQPPLPPRGQPASRGGLVPDAGLGTGPLAPFQLFSGDRTRDGSGASGFASDSMTHVLAPTAVSDLFMSRTNVDALQDAIRYRVSVESDGRHVVGRQSDVELGIVMRSVLLTEGRNVEDAHTVVGQVRALNAAVIAYCVPRIVGEADAYLRYRTDLATLPVPMDRGGLATTKGDRSLGMREFL